MTREEFGATIDGLIEKEGLLDTVNLSGGEPTIHPQFFEFLDIAQAAGDLARLDLDQRPAHRQRLRVLPRARAARKVYVNLQLDALRNPELRVLRGAGDHHAVKVRALDNLERAGVRTTIVVDRRQGRERRPDRRLRPVCSSSATSSSR